MAWKRVVSIEQTVDEKFRHYILTFDSSEVKDSEALHLLLCEVDPGEEYTVHFYNMK